MDLSVQPAGGVTLASPWLTRSYWIHEHLSQGRNEVIRNGLVLVDHIITVHSKSDRLL